MRNVQRPWYSSGAHPQTQSRPVGSDRRTRNGRAEPRSEWPRVCVRWGGFETFSRFDHVGVLPTSRKPSNTTVFSPGRWQSGWFLQRRLSECRCIPESRTHGTTSWWTCCVSNLNRVIDPTTDWASTSTFFKACTLPPDEPEQNLHEPQTALDSSWLPSFPGVHKRRVSGGAGPRRTRKS